MNETLTELTGTSAEIENLLAGRKSPEGLKPRFKVEGEKMLNDGTKVQITVWQDPGEVRHRSIHIIFPKDEAGRYVTDGYDFGTGRYTSDRYPASGDWKSLEQLASRDMSPGDEVEANAWLEKFKAATVEGEVIDNKKNKEG